MALWWKSVVLRVSGHYSTLSRIFEDPAPSDIRWGQVEDLLEALHAKVIRGPGDHTRIMLNDEYEDVQQLKRGSSPNSGTIKSIRQFLERVGVSPNSIKEFLRKVD